MNRFSKAMRNQCGVGLLEVLISMVLLAVGVLGMGMLIAAAIQGNSTSRDNTIVNTLIKRQIESIESLDSFPAVPLSTEENNLAQIYTRRTYMIDNTTDTTIPDGLYMLEVEVSWEGQDLLSHSRRYSTYIQKP